MAKNVKNEGIKGKREHTERIGEWERKTRGSVQGSSNTVYTIWSKYLYICISGTFEYQDSQLTERRVPVIVYRKGDKNSVNSDIFPILPAEKPFTFEWGRATPRCMSKNGPVFCQASLSAGWPPLSSSPYDAESKENVGSSSDDAKLEKMMSLEDTTVEE